MAEYIDKQIILDKCQRLIDVERKQGSDVMNYGRERVNQTEVIMEYIEYMTPTADVIERSKIAKAKINIEIMLEQEKQKDGTYTDVGQGIAIALGLFNNELGEDKENE